MTTTISWLYVSFSWLATLLLVLLVIALLNNFLRRKTTGTLMLLIIYLFFAISKITTSLGFTLQITLAPEIISSQYLTAISSALQLAAIAFLYTFSCRHILRDNELVKTATIFFLAAFFGVILGTMIMDINLFVVEERIITKITQITDELSIIALNLALAIPLIIIQTIIYLRISIRSLVLSRLAEDIVRKRGMQLIGWGLVIYFLGGLMGGLIYSIEMENEIFPFLFWLIRNFTVIVAYFLMYVGWVMPNWYRKRIRKKSWIEEEYLIYVKG